MKITHIAVFKENIDLLTMSDCFVAPESIM